MNIVINAIPLLSPLTGVGNCIYHTARALRDTDARNRYEFYYGYFSKRLLCSSQGDRADAETEFALLRRSKRFFQRNPRARTLVRRFSGTWHRAAARRRRFDLYFEPNYVPLDIKARKLVVSVHDLSFIRHPEWHPKDRIESFGRHFVRRLARADVVTTDSDFTRRELISLVKEDARRIRTVHPGCDHTVFRPRAAGEVEGFRRAHGLPDAFLLFVGSIEPRKNIHRLLDAYARLSGEIRRGCKLVLAGFSGWDNARTMRRMSDMAAEVRFLGYLSDDELALAYNAAEAFVYPSLYEGFGLPAVEAMASGCPVVASDIEPLHETCADAACFVEALSTDEIAAGMHKVLTDNDLRRSLAAKGLQRAAQFGWDLTARKMLDLFEELHGGSEKKGSGPFCL